MKPIEGQDFMKNSGADMVETTSSSLWHDLLFGGKIPQPSADFFKTRFGVGEEEMKKILQIALSKGGDFSELFFEYRISNAVRMEEDIIKESSEDITPSMRRSLSHMRPLECTTHDTK